MVSNFQILSTILNVTRILIDLSSNLLSSGDLDAAEWGVCRKDGRMKLEGRSRALQNF